MKIKQLLLILILFICPLFLSGCANAEGIEEKAFVIALGVDTRG